MTVALLLVGGELDTPWAVVLQRAVSSLGELHAVPEEEALRTVADARYDIIIVDASAVDNAVLLVSRLRAHRPQSRIVVVTASPTWQRAREALRAGAADYFRKSLDEGELCSRIQAVLDAPPPSAQGRRVQGRC